MVVKTAYEFDDNDLLLLKQFMDKKNPCDKCADIHSRCGCPQGIEYENFVKKLQEYNLYDIARKAKQCRQNIDTIVDLVYKSNKLLDDLPQEVRYFAIPPYMPNIKQELQNLFL